MEEKYFGDFDSWKAKYDEDIKASETLYTGNNLSYAVYALQQANEKLSKAVMLLMFIIPSGLEDKEIMALRAEFGLSPDDPKLYGHAWHKKFLAVMANTIDKYERFLKILEKMEIKSDTLKQDIQIFRDNIPNFKRDVENARNFAFNLELTDEKVKSLIDFSKSVLRINEQVEGKISDDAERRIRKSLKDIKNGKVIEGITPQGRKFLIKMLSRFETKGFLEKNMTLDIILMTLCIQSMFLHNPNDDTRYPNYKNIEYDENHPIVKNFREIINIHNSCAEKAILTKKLLNNTNQ